ncbi:MAG: sigma-54 dependent transcriptional regulator [Acidobacteria bacterium]|nr:sigma-54 dependent transcriptional regulator [Acidobacteriota bacterium]
MQLIAVVEDDERILANTLIQLREEGFGAIPFRSAEELVRHIDDTRQIAPDLLLLDIRLPGVSGVELVKMLRDRGMLPPTIVVSGEASITETVDALQLGVMDFIEKPFSPARLAQSVRNALRQAELDREISRLRQASNGGDGILGKSPAIERLRSDIARVAPTNARVMIRGESGTGKELVAKALHEGSARRRGPFVKINCGAIPMHLVEDELFGHARGAFTDAKTAKRGLFEEADGGTIFLDEIGDMDYSLQSRLLRVLEDGAVRRIGETTDRRVDVRVIAATNADIEAMIERREFRDDLYFRLSAVPLTTPQLRARQEDIPLLFVHYIDLFCRQHGRPRLAVSPEAMDELLSYEWPGNVRELRNVCERLAIFAVDPITVDQLPSLLRNRRATRSGIHPNTVTAIVPLREFRTACERDYVETVLKRTNWNFTRAAELLQIQRTYLHQKVASLGIERPKDSG